MMSYAAVPVLVLLLSNVTFTYATTTPSPSHKLPCTAPETTVLSCLNGGQCFALPSHNGLRETGCRCTSEWMGQRCELVDPGVVLEVHGRNVRMAHIAAAVSVVVLVLIAVLAIVFVCAHFKRKTQRNMGKYECSTQDKVIENSQDRELGNTSVIQSTTQFLPNSKSDISSSNNNLTHHKNGNLHISGVDPS